MRAVKTGMVFSTSLVFWLTARHLVREAWSSCVGSFAREQISEQQVIDDSKRLEEIAARQRQACALLDAGRVGEVIGLVAPEQLDLSFQGHLDMTLQFMGMPPPPTQRPMHYGAEPPPPPTQPPVHGGQDAPQPPVQVELPIGNPIFEPWPPLQVVQVEESRLAPSTPVRPTHGHLVSRFERMTGSPLGPFGADQLGSDIVVQGDGEPVGAVDHPSESISTQVSLAVTEAVVGVLPSDCAMVWRSADLQGDHGVAVHLGQTGKPMKDPVGKVMDDLRADLNELMGSSDWSHVFQMDACLRKMFNIDAVCGFVGFEASGVQHRMSQMWRLLFTSRDAMDYDAARTHLDKLGGSVDATADVVGAAAYGHLGDIFRLGGHAVRMPYFTYSIFLLPDSFGSKDGEINVHVLLHSMLLAEGGLRKSANAKFWRGLLEMLTSKLAAKGLMHRLRLKGDAPAAVGSRLRGTSPVSRVVISGDDPIWHCVNSRFTFEGAVDLTSCSVFHGARLLFDTDELSITIASQNQRDANILAICEMIVLLDADGRASKVSAGSRRKVPRGARVAGCFGCQPGKAQHYIAAWDPVNIGARFLVYCAPVRDVLCTEYAHLHAERSDTSQLFLRKLDVQLDLFFGDAKIPDFEPDHDFHDVEEDDAELAADNIGEIECAKAVVMFHILFLTQYIYVVVFLMEIINAC